ncbi:hypothetical protein COY23_00465 [bacterium (Candidatus Torokbacteria) CG_4_10_14_0_2_um_filter_35_8]|nr:MAG: hypothetical protein COY23_00465 [bacterium (Candidatus Torokbacteria) CG_4_10_14_0_2_um_filter_35_8]
MPDIALVFKVKFWPSTEKIFPVLKENFKDFQETYTYEGPKHVNLFFRDRILGKEGEIYKQILELFPNYLEKSDMFPPFSLKDAKRYGVIYEVDREGHLVWWRDLPKTIEVDSVGFCP